MSKLPSASLKLGNDLTKKEIERLIDKYKEYEKTEKGMKDKKTFENIHNAFRKQGFLNRDQLYKVAEWKSTRVLKIVKNNPNQVVKEITKLSLQIEDEGLRIRLLCVLHGIGISRASALLAMYSPEKYGVIDRYAWVALKGKKKFGFSFNDWKEYLGEIQAIAKKYGKKPREIDMALMKHGVEHWGEW